MALMTEQLADFATGVQIADLPEDVVEYTKLVIFDTLVCGIGAARMERTKMAHQVVARLGGPAESTVLGSETKAPAAMAAAFNSEIMYALDADDTLFNSAHFATMVVAPALAEAERISAPGADMVRAVAVGYDVNSRLNLGCSYMEYVDGKFRWSELIGSGYGSLGAAVSAGVVSGLPQEKMLHALALAAGTAPGARNSNSMERRELASFKVCPNMNIVQAGMTALLLAEVGYKGETDLLDLQPGFFEAQGFLSVNRDLILDQLGEHWWILDSAIKYYPSCRYTSAPIDTIRDLMNERGLKPDDIEHIEVRLNPGAYSMSMFNTPEKFIYPDHRGALMGAFNIPYHLALSVLGRTPGARWYEPENTQDPRVWEIASRVSTRPDPELDSDWESAVTESFIGRPRRTRGSLTITARGEEFVTDVEYARGDPWSPRTKASWDSLLQKAFDFCGDYMSRSRIEQLADTVRKLDSVGDVRKVLTPLIQVT